MENSKPWCITFAGPIGSSKTPIANYLSGKLGLPVFNNDALRTEVIEDLGYLDEDIQKEKRNNRIQEILEKRISFILDASIDREWEILKQGLEQYGYQFFIISLDLSKELLATLYQNKQYNDSLLVLDKFHADHAAFVSKYQNVIALTINDSNFKDRLAIAYDAVAQALQPH